LKEKRFTHLNAEQREQLAVLSAQEKSKTVMAKHLGVHKSTVSREFKRKEAVVHKGRYYAFNTQSNIALRKKNVRRKRKTDDPKIQQYIEDKVKIGWSPEIISAKIKGDIGSTINKDSIYTFIYKDKPELTQFLTRKHPGKKPRSKTKKTDRTLIPNRIDIDKRPTEANERKEFGHFEADTIVSRKSLAVLLVIVDRLTRKTKIKKLTRKTALQASISIIFALKEYNIITLKTMTYDNGSEFCWHDKVNEELNMKSFFCHPYSSWEKGTVENINGLIRRFFPKGTDFDKITDEEIQFVEDRINNRPMKVLAFKTPNEKYQELQQNFSVAI